MAEKISKKSMLPIISKKRPFENSKMELRTITKYVA